MLTDWLNEEHLEHSRTPHFLLFLSLSLSLWPVNRVHTPSSPVREKGREKERGGGEGESDEEYGYWIYFIALNNGSFFIFKRNGGCLGTF